MKISLTRAARRRGDADRCAAWPTATSATAVPRSSVSSSDAMARAAGVLLAALLLVAAARGGSGERALDVRAARLELGLDADRDGASSHRVVESVDELKAAFRRASLRAHPDKEGGSHESFVRVAEAYRVLRENADGGGGARWSDFAPPQSSAYWDGPDAGGAREGAGGGDFSGGYPRRHRHRDEEDDASSRASRQRARREREVREQKFDEFFRSQRAWADAAGGGAGAGRDGGFATRRASSSAASAAAASGGRRWYEHEQRNRKSRARPEPPPPSGGSGGHPRHHRAAEDARDDAGGFAPRPRQNRAQNQNQKWWARGDADGAGNNPNARDYHFRHGGRRVPPRATPEGSSAYPPEGSGGAARGPWDVDPWDAEARRAAARGASGEDAREYEYEYARYVDEWIDARETYPHDDDVESMEEYVRRRAWADARGVGGHDRRVGGGAFGDAFGAFGGERERFGDEDVDGGERRDDGGRDGGAGGAWGERSDDEREAVEREAVPVTDVGEAFGVDELCAAGVADYCWGTHATRG